MSNFTSRQEYMERRQRHRDAREKLREIARRTRENLCFNCYRQGHNRFEKCPNPFIIACSKCFQINVFTNRCQCQNPDSKFPGQTLRLAGNKKAPKIYIDIEICGFMFHALYNSSISTTRINHDLASWLFDLTELVCDDVDRNVNKVQVPIARRGRQMNLECRIVKYQERPIELGQDYVYHQGFTFKFDDLTIRSRNSPVSTFPDEINFLYNIPELGASLRHFVKKYGGEVQKPRRATELYGHPKRKTQKIKFTEENISDVGLLEIHAEGDIADLEKI